MRLTVDVDGHNRVIDKLKRDIRRGAKDGLEDLAEIGKETARAKIDSNPRPHIFTGELIASFEYVDYSGRTHLRGKLYNDADHAEAMDEGVPPSAYAARGPPVQALLPWVEEKLSGWTFDNDNDGGSGTFESVFATWDGDLVAGEVDESYRKYDDSVQPNREDLYIGQRGVFGNRDTGEIKRGEVVFQSGNSVTIDFDDDSTSTFEVDGSNNEMLFLGSERWQDRTYDQKIEDIRTYFKQKYSPFSDSFHTKITDTVTDRFYDNFKDIEQAKYVANSLHEIQEYTGDASAAATNYGGTKRYILKYRDTNHETTIIHENVHGFHLSQGYYRDAYADMPDSDSSYVYPDFLFDRDGTSQTGIADMDQHLLRHDKYGMPGRDKKGEVYDLAVGNYNLNYDTSISATDHFDPDNPDFSAGDIIRLKFDQGDAGGEYEITDGTLIGHRETDQFWLQVREVETDSADNILIDTDGSLPPGITLNGVDTGGIDDSLPVSNTDDEVYNLMEAANLVWMHKVFTLSEWKRENLKRPEEPLDELNHFWREYDVKNPNEVLTNLVETMMTDFVINTKSLPNVDDAKRLQRNYPELFDAFIEIWDPSEEVMNRLDEAGINY